MKLKSHDLLFFVRDGRRVEVKFRMFAGGVVTKTKQGGSNFGPFVIT